MEADKLQQLMLRSAKFDEPFERALSLCGLGLTGESGEVADLVKKIVYHHHEYTEEKRQKLLVELGDVAWYTAYLCRTLGSSFEEIFQINIDKLNKRFPQGFNTADSLARRDVVEEKVKA